MTRAWGRRWAWSPFAAMWPVFATVVAMVAVPSSASAALRTGPATAAAGRPLVMAHYYIWFDRKSWNRAKKDLPTVGAYSSDSASVMRTQIEEAKASGIDGFIVGWKSSPTLDRRLRQLITIAESEHFKLALTYQALNFDRNPLPVATVGRDLDHFIKDFSTSPAFAILDKPLVIWSGTWKFSKSDIESVTAGRRARLKILASEKSATDYQRVAGAVDGDMYYWSSVNPSRYPGYPSKIVAFSAAVHRNKGLWIAPAAPGFDARDVQGTSTVDRNDGATLRSEWQGAVASSPDAIGIISWNEFSENTYIEPSKAFGNRYLQVLATLTKAKGPAVTISGTGADDHSLTGRLLIIGGFAAVVAGATLLAVRRSRKARALV